MYRSSSCPTLAVFRPLASERRVALRDSRMPMLYCDLTAEDLVAAADNPAAHLVAVKPTRLSTVLQRAGLSADASAAVSPVPTGDVSLASQLTSQEQATNALYRRTQEASRAMVAEAERLRTREEALAGHSHGGKGPMTAVAEAPMTAVGARPKEERDDDSQSNRKRKALLFFQKQGRGGGKGKGAGFSRRWPLPRLTTQQCQMTQLRWWKTPRHWLATLPPPPRGTWHPRRSPRRPRQGPRRRRLLPRRRLPASAWLAEQRRGYVPGQGDMLNQQSLLSLPSVFDIHRLIQTPPAQCSLKLSQDLLRSPWVY